MMSERRKRDPSPARSALIHSGLALTCFVSMLGFGGAIIEMTGDEMAGSPMVRMALFEPETMQSASFGPSWKGASMADAPAAMSLRGELSESAPEPSLGIEYAPPKARPAPAQPRKSTRKPQAAGIIINGKVVPFGKSLREVEEEESTSTAAISVNTLSVRLPAAETYKPASPGPYTKNARAFENSQNKPTISLIVGGLGVNYGRTVAAINKLPPEVTLSFAPTATNLKGWIRRARRAGHEVLIEVPMEPYDYGRLKPHENILLSRLDEAANLSRLKRVLAGATGYVGVMNYQGEKFATDPASVTPVLEFLKQRDIAFFENGRLARSEFADQAKAMPFGEATSWIDSRMEADEISEQLMLLEAMAREHGKSLGTGQSFPVTLDLLEAWIPTLEKKGILLAPASYYARPASGQADHLKLAELDTKG